MRDPTRHSDQMRVQPSRPITRLGVSSYGDQADEKYRHLTITPPLLDHLIGAAEKYPFVARLNRPDRATARLLLGVFLLLIRRGGAAVLTHFGGGVCIAAV